MQKQAPTTFQMATIVGFALSCFGILLFLWVSFGGPTPLKARSYEVKVPFTEASLLAEQSDVRIAGVSVGKVTAIELGKGTNSGRAVATVEIDPKYAPLPTDTRAILRQKTLLGETYVELSPGNSNSGDLPDGSQLPPGQVADSVQLDEIYRTFDEKTRVAFRVWMQEAAVGLAGRGADLNAAFGLLDPTFEEANKTLTTLDTQSEAVSRFIRNTGVVFNAISERQGQLQGLIRNTNTVFTTTAQRAQDLQNLFVVFPTFLRESRLTLNRLDRFALNADPLVIQLRPSARDLGPVLQSTARLAPHLQRFFEGLGPVVAAAPTGFPALRRFLLSDLPPILGRMPSFFDQLNPLLDEVRIYRQEITSFLANGAAATNGISRSPETSNAPANYLRTSVPLGPDSVASYPNRLRMNRNNPYLKPLGYLNINKGGIQSFQTYQCSSGINAIFRDWADLTPGEQANFNSTTANGGERLYTNLKKFSFAEQTNSDDAPAPACIQQGPLSPLGASDEAPSRYRHVFPGR